MKSLISVGLLAISCMLMPASSSFAAGSGEITLIHMGDLHGHLLPRPNLRSDGSKREEGGVARMYSQIQTIRKRHKHSLLLNTGDTIQGSAEALYTQGQAQVDVLNRFGIDAFAPGNWEFVYGTARFLELFGPSQPKAPWNTLGANLFYDGEPYADKSGQRVLPPYIVKQVGGLKIGLLGLTTDRGPQVVGKGVTKGFRYLKNGDELDTEVARQVKALRETEQVDVLVMLSEMGLANNIRIAEKILGIDVVLSSDMHEVAMKPVVTNSGTIIVEEGQDGTRLGELTLNIKNGKVVDSKWTQHVIDSRIKEDRNIARLVREIRKPFVAGPDFKQLSNPFNGTLLKQPIDTVVGHTKTGLHRSNFSHETMPGVIEGSSHDFLTDAFRVQADADIGAIRGFRYGTHVAPGPIKLEDLYHFIPIGPMIAKGTIQGKQLKGQIENAADGSLNPSVSGWTGGWLFNFSGVTMDFDPYAEKGKRASNIKVYNHQTQTWDALNPDSSYSYASYYYERDPNLINVVEAKDITVIKDEQGNAMDGVEVVVRYLQSLPDKTADPQLNRIKLLKALPQAAFGNPEVQPLSGARQ